MKIVYFNTAFHMETENMKSCQFYACFDNQQEVDGIFVAGTIDVAGEKLSPMQEKLIRQALKDRGY